MDIKKSQLAIGCAALFMFAASGVNAQSITPPKLSLFGDQEPKPSIEININAAHAAKKAFEAERARRQNTIADKLLGNASASAKKQTEKMPGEGDIVVEKEDTQVPEVTAIETLPEPDDQKPLENVEATESREFTAGFDVIDAVPDIPKAKEMEAEEEEDIAETDPSLPASLRFKQQNQEIQPKISAPDVTEESKKEVAKPVTPPVAKKKPPVLASISQPTKLDEEMPEPALTKNVEVSDESKHVLENQLLLELKSAAIEEDSTDIALQDQKKNNGGFVPIENNASEQQKQEKRKGLFDMMGSWFGGDSPEKASEEDIASVAPASNAQQIPDDFISFRELQDKDNLGKHYKIEQPQVVTLPAPPPSSDALSIASMFDEETLPEKIDDVPASPTFNEVKTEDIISDIPLKKELEAADKEVKELPASMQKAETKAPSSILPKKITETESAVKEKAVESVEKVEQEVAMLSKPSEVSKKMSSDVNQRSIFFPRDDTELSEETQKELSDIIVRLMADPKLRLTITGFASNDDDISNTARRISLKRALALRKYFISQGINSIRITVQAMGNNTAELKKDRVDLVLINTTA